MIKDPKIWGPQMWMVLHYLTFVYEPSKDKQKYKRFFQHHVVNLIPCKPCRQNYCRHIKTFPIKLDSKESLSRWLVKIHNLINKRLEKKTVSYDVVVNKYKRITKKKVMTAFLKFQTITKRNMTDEETTQKIPTANTELISIFFQKI